MQIRNVNIMSNSVFEILLLLVSLTVQASGAAPGLAKPGCNDTCGNINIPFPFGIGAGCFMDEWYEIDCQQSGMVPILKKIELPVLNISLPNYYRSMNGMISVRLPLIYSNVSCGGDGYGVPVSLEGSQFVFSKTWNIFISVGCNTLATVNSTESAVVGCRSKCAGTNISLDSACSGRDGCCQTTLPSSLQSISIDFKEEGGHQVCNYAFLADRSWFLRSNSTGLYDLRLKDTVRVVLEWGIPNTTIDAPELIGQVQANFSCTGYNLYDQNLYHSSETMPFTQCYCGTGYRGNPYLLGGCLDIDECEGSYRCLGTCINIPGSFKCVDGRKKATFILIVLGACVGGLVQVLLLSRWLYKVIKKRREIKQKEKYFKTQWGLLLQQHLSSSPEGNVAKSKLFHFKDLEKATDRFNQDRILGQGGQGVVFKGMLANGKIVAVKKSKLMDKEKIEEFINEVIILSQINHRNVVKLMGCCLETEIPLLVYEFIPNGTLYKYLHDPNEDLLISWDTRLRIATEIAEALSYLHLAASIPIYHRDIKSTNILLDEKHRAKVADFGISKSVSPDETHVTTLVRGTFGYLDPEYFRTGHFTDKSDVYSLGVVLVELLTGQMPICQLREEGRSLADYFINSMEQNCLFDIADARVMKEGKKEEITAVANLTRRCLSSIGWKRPTMKEVAMELEGIRKLRSSLSFQQNQEKIKVAESRDSIFTSGKSFVDMGVTTFSDEQPLAHCESW
ncbi:wall-associated receptor kinase-like 1 [Syzygium oleosum]|uniref:wall-associated receptor kinase-like 1 n=1 Tax=Syzygium oleosum TaxID=219896 RepID=UPI0024BB84DF|nr:wall-associated receptor kinase-like 1 [Syzygium oleosum]